ncbi:phosphatidate cytidylyltransferase [Pseudothermotoga thermarum]|uniref:Phosphatidate cytidylyltransferase n=1 Tax=Pseudothermotoga thermarum DSM 5069 TaxID=688269 RepID=F7YVZ5_9THEM|nr:phosphatidate cytidylyltransferase [Pseudothermotoga thermarum]AEH51827.1 phosphatidate cytidylyltransferase [Pseudothermotoga thermarum DSM 5069]
MSETRTRVITAFIVAPFVVACFVSYKSLIGLVSAVVLLASYELLSMSTSSDKNKYLIHVGVILNVAFVVLYGFSKAENGLLYLSLMFIASAIFLVIFVEEIPQVWNAVLGTILSLIYVAGCLSFFFPIYLKFGWANALLTLTAVWLYDTGAYFVGIKFGKTKISKKFSPNKSLEGIIGGFLSCLAFSIVYKAFFEWLFDAQVMPYASLPIFSAVVSVFDTFGDIFESALKRYFNKKDSGVVLPGHGGMLDRIDGLLFVTPVTYILLTYGIL